MTKEEILKSWDKYEIFSKTYFELAISAMQEYADQQTSELKAELNELKERHKRDVEEAFNESREKINYPDWDYVYDDFEQYYKQKFESND